MGSDPEGALVLFDVDVVVNEAEDRLEEEEANNYDADDWVGGV